MIDWRSSSFHAHRAPTSSKRLRSGFDQTTVMGSLTHKRAAEFEVTVRMLLIVDTDDLT